MRKITEGLLASLGLADRDISILIVNNRNIWKLNRELFGRDRPTNVISFSYMDGLPGEVIGDIVISAERAEEEALSMTVPFYERLFALIIHGILHVLGFDHETDRKEARRMRYREGKLLAFVKGQEAYRPLLGAK